MTNNRPDKSHYIKMRMVRTYPPAYVKKLLTAIAYSKSSSISDISSKALQEYVDRLSDETKKALIATYDNMSPNARLRPKSAKNGY